VKDAFVAAARRSCVRCGHDIKVVCIYCKSGVDTEIGDPLLNFTVFNIWAMDGVLAKLMQRLREVDHATDTRRLYSRRNRRHP
jgi:hypothetical protein